MTPNTQPIFILTLGGKELAVSSLPELERMIYPAFSGERCEISLSMRIQEKRGLLERWLYTALGVAVPEEKSAVIATCSGEECLLVFVEDGSEWVAVDTTRANVAGAVQMRTLNGESFLRERRGCVDSSAVVRAMVGFYESGKRIQELDWRRS